MKIAVYTIALNEEQFVQRWFDSAKEADYLVIVDTGSTDNTVRLAEALGITVHSIKVKPWRFDDARNAALFLLPEDVDYCISLDMDEVLMPGWREAFDRLDPRVTRPKYKYVWSSNPDGTEALTFGGDKIHARHGYRWTHPVHEVLVANGIEEIMGWVDVDLRHYPDASKSRGQYLPLLELSVREDPNDDRNLFYLGREYMYHGIKDKAIECLLKHLTISTWHAERATGMRYLANLTGNKEPWLLKACAEAPERREPWVDLAQYYHDIKNWEGSYFAAKRSLFIQERPMEYLCEPHAWGSLPEDLCGVAAWGIGRFDESLMLTISALRKSPEDSRIRSNLKMMFKKNRINDVHVIIPCKSNLSGLLTVLSLLDKEESVVSVSVVADGDEAYENISSMFKTAGIEGVNLIRSELGDGIHVMWNIGMDLSDSKHQLFANDDIVFHEGAIDILAATLDFDSNIGVVCPNYDGRLIKDYYQSVSIACPGNYDGTDGLAGFCMMLRNDMADNWSFDERMKWYYGDNDLVNWVRDNEKHAAISGIATMELNPSWTKRNDPPKDFDKLVEQDRIIFEEKWNKI